MIAAQQPEVSQPKPGLFPFGLILHYFFHALLGFFGVAQPFVEMAEIPQCAGMRGGDLQSMFVGFAGRRQIAAFLQRGSEIGVCQLAFRLQLDGFRIRLSGLLHAIDFLIGQAEIEPGFVRFGSGFHQLRAMLRGGLEIAARDGRCSQPFERRPARRAVPSAAFHSTREPWRLLLSEARCPIMLVSNSALDALLASSLV